MIADKKDLPLTKASGKLYRQAPEYKQRQKQYQRAFRLKPEYKQRQQAYRQAPEHKKREKLRQQAYRLTPEYKQRMKAYLSTPEFKQRQEAYLSTPEYKQHRRETIRKKKYGLTPDDYATMLAFAPVCEICGSEFAESGPCIDHCHRSLEVRGLLCSRCNKLLGFAKDRPTVLRMAARYLEDRRLR